MTWGLAACALAVLLLAWAARAAPAPWPAHRTRDWGGPDDPLRRAHRELILSCCFPDNGDDNADDR